MGLVLFIIVRKHITKNPELTEHCNIKLSNSEGVNCMRKVYVCHQYYEPSHFKALYECAQEHGYQIMDLIVLNPRSAVSHRNKLIEQVGLKIADEWYQNNFINQGKLWLLKDEIIIVGIAPYDRLLAQYQGVLAQNHSIYMTSWTDWHSGNVPYPYQDNKAGFMETLTNDIDGVACVSGKTEKEISSWKSVTQVVNHAIDTGTYAKKTDYTRKGRYIYLGRLVEEKNIRAIVDYMKSHPGKEMKVDFAGDGGLRESLERYATQDSRICLLGQLSKEEIKARLKDYDYLILPSFHELFGIVLLEALASGVPCIVSNAAGPIEVISHNNTGIVFRLEDKDGFDRAMDYSLELSDSLYETMCKNAISESRKYDCSEVVKKWVNLFERVCV